MNGARALIRTLVNSDVDVCFANPGTSEMHFVAALDDVPEMRAVLTLFEGVATGAADGYARMLRRPAATLLHLGPGLGNGIANLHNARRARSPVVNVIGDHARSHKRLDAPLESDVDALAGAVSGWVRRSLSAADVGADAADAVAASFVGSGSVATLVLPADVSWSEGAMAAPGEPRRPRPLTAPAVVEEIAALLALGEPTVFYLDGDGLSEGGLLAAAQIAAGTGVRLLARTHLARMTRGAGLPNVALLPRSPEEARPALAGTRHLVLVGAPSPVAAFGYPGMPGTFVPESCQVHVLAEPGEDIVTALQALADLSAPSASPVLALASRPDLPSGQLTPALMTAVIGALLPEGAIVSDESITSGRDLVSATAGAPRHDWLGVTGGAIGGGLPVALGAAVACPDRPVIAIQADGSAMYTATALWTYAREQLDVTTIVCNNGSYAILEGELKRVGASGDGKRAAQLLDIGKPDLDFVALAAAMGVPGTRADTADDLATQLRRALAEPGPHLIDAVLPRRR